MRIISGKARGTKLYTLKGIETRPTLDRVKESFFNIISPNILNATVIDLFAGSGAIGLEFASRGAKKVYLCDISKDAVNIIKKNIQKTHLEENVEIYNCDFKKILRHLKNEKIDIVYIDPPYKTDYIKEAIKEIININIMNLNTILIVETDEVNRITNELKEWESIIKIIDQRKYGRANLIFIKKIK